MNLSVIIVVYNSAEVIDKCIANIAGLECVEVLFIDNNSTDNTVAIIQQRGFDVYTMEANLGFAVAANHGASLANGDLLCFLNPDCEINNNLCEIALKSLEYDLKNCAVPNYKRGEELINGIQCGYTPLKILADLFEHKKYFSKLSNICKNSIFYNDYSWYWPIAACLFIPRQTFFSIDCFSEDYFLYMEDVELGRILSEQGGKIKSLPVAVEHCWGTGSQISNNRRIKYLNEARSIYAKKHYNWIVNLVVRFINKLP